MFQLGNDEGNGIIGLVAHYRARDRLEQGLHTKLLQVVLDSAADLRACGDERGASTVYTRRHEKCGGRDKEK